MVPAGGWLDIVDMSLRLSGSSTVRGVGFVAVTAVAVGAGALLLGRGRSNGGGVAPAPAAPASVSTPPAVASAQAFASEPALPAQPQPIPAGDTASVRQVAPPPPLRMEADSDGADLGRPLYLTSCITCHGPKGQGMPHMGPDLRTSQFVARATDAKLVEFIKAGRLPTDADSVMTLFMPPRGGNGSLTEAQLRQVVSFLRQLQADAAREKGDAPPLPPQGPPALPAAPL